MNAPSEHCTPNTDERQLHPLVGPPWLLSAYLSLPVLPSNGHIFAFSVVRKVSEISHLSLKTGISL